MDSFYLQADCLCLNGNVKTAYQIVHSAEAVNLFSPSLPYFHLLGEAQASVCLHFHSSIQPNRPTSSPPDTPLRTVTAG